ncbi:uncharacterized protein LOC119604853 isoform X2 [Lucilia sericata]|uniref:uncharacterized protein LOC119604853 isoform X2 n=1 Tax=Lucilia sericata TaxID=13632 RepID=UPI0018A84B9F|nr:uncharacterized protein LOC119604853 isoform X2 [Lucilia sericata]
MKPKIVMMKYTSSYKSRSSITPTEKSSISSNESINKVSDTIQKKIPVNKVENISSDITFIEGSCFQTDSHNSANLPNASDENITPDLTNGRTNVNCNQSIIVSDQPIVRLKKLPAITSKSFNKSPIILHETKPSYDVRSEPFPLISETNKKKIKRISKTLNRKKSRSSITPTEKSPKLQYKISRKKSSISVSNNEGFKTTGHNRTKLSNASNENITPNPSNTYIEFDIAHNSTEINNFSESLNECFADSTNGSTIAKSNESIPVSDYTLNSSLLIETNSYNSAEISSFKQNYTVNVSNSIDSSVEIHNISKECAFVTNESLSEYLPDTTNDNTIESLNFNNTPMQETEKSVQEITSPLHISSVNIPVSSKSKKHFCIFCKTLQTKLARHLIHKHKSEKQVKAILHLPKKNRERVKLIDQLRKDGDYLHNTTKSLNTGILICTRQQQSKVNNEANDYVCCKKCKGFYSKKTLRLHLRKCGVFSKNDRTNLIAGRRLTQYIHEGANEILKTKIFPILRDDKITRVIRYDDLIIKFGNKLAEKYTLTHQHDMVRSHLRLLGRFKIAINEFCPDINELKQIFKPQFFDACIKALRKVANWDNSLMWFKTPAVAQHLTSLIKKCGYKQRTELIKIQDEDLKKDLDDFLLLWEEEIPTLINKKACEDQANQKRNKKTVLPSREDIKKLYLYLKNKIIEEIKVLEKKFSYQSWMELVKSTLIFIQIFNRRRAGEIERLTLSNYKNKEGITGNIEEDILKTISEESLDFAKQFVRISIRGKLGRTVSVLLNPLCVQAIEEIIKHREAAGITSSNEYIFCKRSTSTLSKEYFRACPLLKQFSMECGARIPESLRGTTLRKHIATHTSLLNVEEASVDRLANFMGHHKDIHKNFYRMSVPVSEITCVSKLLMNAIGEENEEGDEVFENMVDEEGELETRTEFNSNSYIDSNKSEASDESSMSEEVPKKKKKKRRSTSPFGTTKRSRWSQEERDAINSCFGCLRDLEKLPSLTECLHAIIKCPVLKNRTPAQIKTWIDNQRRYK